MKGTLVSENTDAIVFKDDSGVQFSLKKTGLDLDKMKEANDAEAAAVAATPAPPATAAQPAPAAPATKPAKKARVYTKDDLDKLKERYGELTTGTPIENSEDFSSPGVLKPEAYLKMVRDAAAPLSQIAQNLDLLGAGINTQWEVAASTGKNATEAIQSYMKGESASAIITTYTTQIAAAQDVKERLGTPPRGYQELGKIYDTALTSIQNYYDLIRGYASVQNSSVFKSRLDEMKMKVNSSVMSLQGWQPPSAMQPATSAPAQTSPSGVEPQTQQ